MGQKVNPNGIRLGINQDWRSKWYVNSKDYAEYLKADAEIRKYLYKKLKAASISRIQIERPARTANITIYSARPGAIIGKKGGEVDVLRAEIATLALPDHRL